MKIAVGRPTRMVTTSRGVEVVTPRRLDRTSQLCTEGKLRRAGRHHGEGSVVLKVRKARRKTESLKRGEPQGRKRTETCTQRRHGGGEGSEEPEHHRREEEPVETVRNREDGTRRKVGAFFPKGAWIELARERCPGVDSPTRDDGGASLDNPKRGNPASQGAGSRDQVVSGKTARRSRGSGR